MSKSLGNYIGIDERAREIYGKTMSIPDPLIVRYAELAAGMSVEAVEAMRRGLEEGNLHPREAKAEVAKKLVALYHGEQAAEEAALEFDRIFREKGLPNDIPIFEVPEGHIDQEEGIKNTVSIAWLIAASEGTKSVSEAKRLIRQGGVSLDGEVMRDEHYKVQLDQEHLLKVGKRFFRRIKKGPLRRKNT